MAGARNYVAARGGSPELKVCRAHDAVEGAVPPPEQGPLFRKLQRPPLELDADLDGVCFSNSILVDGRARDPAPEADRRRSVTRRAERRGAATRYD